MRCRALALALVLLLPAMPSIAQQPTSLNTELARVDDATTKRDYTAALPHAERAAQLARTDPAVPVSERIKVLNVLTQLYYLTGDYPAAEKTTRDVLELRRAGDSDVRAIAVTQEDLAELLDLQGEFSEAAPLHASAAAAFDTVERGAGAAAASALGRSGGAPLRSRAFDFYDRQDPEDPGYGRYTYVLLPTNSDRGRALLETILDEPAGAGLSEHNRAVVNAFEIPVADNRRGDARTQAGPSADGSIADKAARVRKLYDFSAANNVILTACQNATKPTAGTCADQTAGPFLITFSHPVSAYAGLPPGPFLVVDLSNFQVAAFPYVVKTLQNQLEGKDLAHVSDRNVVGTTQVSLLNMVLLTKDWLTPISDSVTQWTKILTPK